MAEKSKFYADIGLETGQDLLVDGNATVTGNLTVNGTQTTVNSTTTSVTDSMIELANSNTGSDTLDIGIYGNYDDGLSDGGASEYTGLFRDASDSTWKLFDGLESEPTTTVNTAGTGYAKAALEVGDLSCTTLTATNSLTGASLTYPTSDGTNGQVLTTNGSGTLSFSTISGYTDSDVETYLDGGTSTPTFSSINSTGTINVNPSSSGDAVLLLQNGADTQTLRVDQNSIRTTTNSDIHIFTNGNTNQLFLNQSSGNVGIGTNAPDDLLHVYAGNSGAAPHSLSAFNIESASDVAMNFLTPNTSQAQIRFADPQDDGKGIIGYNHSSDYMFFATNGPEKMRITSNGEVVIGGTEIPSTVLDGTGAAGALGIGNSTQLYPAIALMSSARNWIVYQNTAGNFNIYDSTENKERMSIGNDGATTFSPTTVSDDYGFKVITGNSADTGIKIGRTGASNAMFGLAVVSNGTSSIGRLQFDGDGDVAFGDAANIELRDGNLVRIGAAFTNATYATNRAVYAEDQGELGYNASVRASKTNITDVGDVSWLYNLNAKTFNKRKKIQGEKQSDGTYSYTYSDTEHSGITEYGFIAEDLEALAPELCFYGYTRDVDADGNELDTFTKGELQGIHYDAMVAPMLKLIQTQKDEIDALEARIATLESV